eukprot:g967.t1
MAARARVLLFGLACGALAAAGHDPSYIALMRGGETGDDAASRRLASVLHPVALPNDYGDSASLQWETCKHTTCFTALRNCTDAFGRMHTIRAVHVSHPNISDSPDHWHRATETSRGGGAHWCRYSKDTLKCTCMCAESPRASPYRNNNVSRGLSPAVPQRRTLALGAKTPVPAGYVTLAHAAPNELLRLVRAPHEGAGPGELAARSYDGHKWESAAPLRLGLACNVDPVEPLFATEQAMPAGGPEHPMKVCGTHIPVDGTSCALCGRYYVEAVNVSATPSARERAARLLMRGTFGPTRDAIQELASSAGCANGKAEAPWVQKQMALPPTLHRAYYRKRSNPRFPGGGAARIPAGTKSLPCAPGSRWHRFALTEADVGKYMIVRKCTRSSCVAGAGAPVVLDVLVDGHWRTGIEVGNFVTEPEEFLQGALTGDATVALRVCSVEERVGGAVTLADASKVQIDCTVWAVNPPVTQIPPNVSRIAVMVTSQDDLSDLQPNVTDTKVLVDGVPADDPAAARCANAPPTGPIFMAVEDDVYAFDRRVALARNTVPEPTAMTTPPALRDECATVVKTFLNERSCVVGEQTCARVQFSSAWLQLNDSTVRLFGTAAGKRVHYVQGLRLGPGASSPCNGQKSRWVSRANATCSDAASQPAVEAALGSCTRSNDEEKCNARVRDVVLAAGVGCTVTAGDTVHVNGTCWQHVHAQELNVYDFSFFALTAEELQASGSDKIQASALETLVARHVPALDWPANTPMSQWTAILHSRNHVPLLGRLGDSVDFRHLPSSVQDERMARAVGAESVRGDAGYESCGSPGESGNHPLLGHMYSMALGEPGSSVNSAEHAQKMDRSSRAAVNRRNQKNVVWQNAVLNAPDQLRQRMAWALSQIFVINEDDVGKSKETEAWVAYYDIFVRNAFGNYRDVLREVSHSPMMGRMLTFIDAKSIAAGGSFPDENYAREVMQLFSMGVWQLHDDGTQVKDPITGRAKLTYDMDDVASLAGAWTGFRLQQSRGNIEHANDKTSPNFVDPMRIDANWRDRFPKRAPGGGFIGDQYPLCTDLPARTHMRKGARYRYIGGPEPEKQPGVDSIATTTRNLRLKPASKLFKALCNAPIASVAEEPHCHLKSEVVLSDDLPCGIESVAPGEATECSVDAPRVVALPGVGATSPDGRMDVYYEYIRPPCTHLAVLADDQAALLTSRWGLSDKAATVRYQAKAVCANKFDVAASVVCCNKPSESAMQSETKAKCIPAAVDEQPSLVPSGVSLVVQEPAACISGCSGKKEPIEWQVILHTTADAKGGTSATRLVVEGNNGAMFPIHGVASFAFDGVRLKLRPTEPGTAHSEAELSAMLSQFQQLFPQGTRLTIRPVVYPSSMFTNEKVTHQTAQDRCRDAGKELCNFERVVSTDSACSLGGSFGYFWSTGERECTSQVQVYSSGHISIVDAIPELADKSGIPQSLPLDSASRFHVQWAGGKYPTAKDGCGAACDVRGDSCVCDTEVTTTAVFTNVSALSAHDVLHERLKVGAFDPRMFDAGVYAAYCARGGGSSFTAGECETFGGVSVFVRGEAPASPSQVVLDTDTIFRVISTQSKNPTNTAFLRNVAFTVRLPDDSSGSTAGEFRNPPSFHSRFERTIRDAEDETEAVINAYFDNDSVPPHVAQLFIQRFVTSNPSPRYVEAVSTAFKRGKYTHDCEKFGSGRRGDLAATLAAVLLDREAQSPILDQDPAFGKVREPVVKLMHLMRALEFEPRRGMDEVFLTLDKIGQTPFRAPSVFGFFQPDFRPDGDTADAALVAPEGVMLGAPDLLAWLNGVHSLIRWGLTECDDGLTQLKGQSCHALVKKGIGNSVGSAGALSFALSSHVQDADAAAVVDELDVLLTGGRLSPHTRALIEGAFRRELDAGSTGSQALAVAQQLFVASAEFHTTSANHLAGAVRQPPAPIASAAADSKPYKAIVYLFLSGGADSYNMLVPRCADAYAHYANARGTMALERDALLDISAGDTQACTDFGLHPRMQTVQRLYKDGDALFVANAGPLVEPLNRTEFYAKTKRVPSALFGHRVQTRLTQTVDATSRSRSDGVIGRMVDALRFAGHSVGSYSLKTEALVLEPEKSAPFDVVTNWGVPQLSRHSAPLLPDIRNLTTRLSTSPLAEAWTNALDVSLARADLLGKALLAVPEPAGFGSSHVAKGLKQVARMIKASNSQGSTVSNERDVFYVHTGGFDDHSNMLERMDSSLHTVDAALAAFESEMKSQGRWADVTVVQASEFGRTLTSNGDGTDHGWGGHYFVAGGAVRGGQVLGSYPDDLSEQGAHRLRRGRMVPTTSWEQVWNGVGEWFGLRQAQLDAVLPNRRNFQSLFSASDMFNVPASDSGGYDEYLATLVVECGTNHCNGRGTIQGTTTHNNCTCTDCTGGWGGATCSEKLACAADLCQHDGAVSGNQVDGCQCACNDPWLGSTCSVHKDTCPANYCNGRGAISGNIVDGCVCTACAGNYEGSRCQTPKACDKDMCNGKFGAVDGNMVVGCSCKACSGGYEGKTCKDKVACHKEHSAGQRPKVVCVNGAVSGNKADGCKSLHE